MEIVVVVAVAMAAVMPMDALKGKYN